MTYSSSTITLKMSTEFFIEIGMHLKSLYRVYILCGENVEKAFGRIQYSLVVLKKKDPLQTRNS